MLKVNAKSKLGGKESTELTLRVCMDFNEEFIQIPPRTDHS